ncbi:homoserine O-succinyltransferase [Marinicauda algicola]|uniref:Homoserine O-succinyltransferase n=1 Tax=Marinicauda algicola TaxID=2029849 RepID=A0A4S2GWQ4_9PROT|nr:homoserine O-succinyltransferase [Marinicauda algicola]TGY87570.1 homoserine O-succinyltransferase [Marinicauda algicola]
MSIQTADHIASFEPGPGRWIETAGRVTGAPGKPGVIVLGGISAHRRLVADGTGPGWWPGVAGPGGALDPARYRLLSFDFLAETVAPFPTIHDQARALAALADAAGFDRFSVVGASYGGTIALALAAMAPQRVSRIAVLAAAGRVHPMATAWRSIQRDIVRFALARNDGAGGVDLARRLAMTTYRTAEEFEQRFRDPDPDSRDAAGVAAYLKTRGADYAAKTPPQRFLALSRSMDEVELDLSAIRCPVALLGFESDRLVPPADVEWTAAQLADARCEIAASLYGHDGFLKEPARVNAFLEDLL